MRSRLPSDGTETETLTGSESKNKSIWKKLLPSAPSFWSDHRRIFTVSVVYIQFSPLLHRSIISVNWAESEVPDLGRCTIAKVERSTATANVLVQSMTIGRIFHPLLGG